MTEAAELEDIVELTGEFGFLLDLKTDEKTEEMELRVARPASLPNCVIVEIMETLESRRLG